MDKRGGHCQESYNGDAGAISHSSDHGRQMCVMCVLALEIQTCGFQRMFWWDLLKGDNYSLELRWHLLAHFALFLQTRARAHLALVPLHVITSKFDINLSVKP